MSSRRDGTGRGDGAGRGDGTGHRHDPGPAVLRPDRDEGRGEARRERRGEAPARLVACAVLAFLLVNYPLLAVFGDGGQVLGVPVLPLYVFAAWGLVVALAARLSRGR